MAHIDALIDKVVDPALRQALRDQMDVLLHRQSFGLVFQEHKPETVELPQYRVVRGCKVRYRGSDDARVYRVERTRAGVASLITLDEAADTSEAPVEDLVVVREFGEPIWITRLAGVHSHSPSSGLPLACGRWMDHQALGLSPGLHTPPLPATHARSEDGW